MPLLKDLTGSKFGRLLVTKRVQNEFNNSANKEVIYECQCECGEVIITSGKLLRSGDKKKVVVAYKKNIIKKFIK